MIIFYFIGTDYLSTFYGTSGSPILMQQHHTILYIQMILGSGGNTYGSYFLRFWKIESVLDNYHQSKSWSIANTPYTSSYSWCSMRDFPSWSSLKHFNYVATVSFTDGQSFYDILKVNFLFLDCSSSLKMFSAYFHALCSFFHKIHHLYIVSESINVIA